MTSEEQKRIDEEFRRILFKSEKKFADNALLYFSEGYFALCVYNGESSQVFVLTPYQVKRLARTFGQQILRYEASFGEVKIDLSIPSPLQQSDLQNPSEESDDEKGDSGKKPKKPGPEKPKK